MPYIPWFATAPNLCEVKQCYFSNKISNSTKCTFSDWRYHLLKTKTLTTTTTKSQPFVPYLF